MTMKKIQVSYLGLNSLFGRVTTSLLKQSPCIEKLSLYDDDETSLLEDGANVYIGTDQLPDAVKDVNIVVIGDEPCQCKEEERLKIIGPKIIRFTEAILKSSPNAIIVVAASPLNTLVPLVAHFLGPEWKNRLLGVTSVDTMRSSRLFNRFLENTLGPTHVLPVIGGSSAASRVPLFSHLHPKIVVCKDVREKVLEKMKLFDSPKCQELDSVERAYSTVRFIHSVISGMLKDAPIPEIAMIKSAVVPGTEFISLPMLIGKNGVENSLPLPKLDEAEEDLFLKATEILADDSRKARGFINSLAQESVRNSKTITNASTCKSLAWNTNSQFSDDHTSPANSELRVVSVEETAITPEIVPTQPKFTKISKLLNDSRVKDARNTKSGSRDTDKNRLVPTTNDIFAREPVSFTYRLLANSSNEESQEIQPVSRKPIPKCPSYQLIPECKGINRDLLKGKCDDTVEAIENRKTVEPTEKGVMSLSSAVDTSSKGGISWQSPTRTALETSNRTGSFKGHDIPQPSSIQHLLPEVVPLEPVPPPQPVPQTGDNCEKENGVIEERPSLPDSEVLAKEGNDYTDALLEEVNNNIGALNKYTDTFASVEASKNENDFEQSNICNVIDGNIPSKTDENYTKHQAESESMKQDVNLNNDEITSNSNAQNLSERVVEVRNVNEPRQISNYEIVPEFVNRKSPISPTKWDSGEKSVVIDKKSVSGMIENTGSKTRESDANRINKTSQYSPSFSAFNRNKIDKSRNDYGLQKKCDLEKDELKSNLGSEEIVGKRWTKKQSDENTWGTSTGVTPHDSHPKNISNENDDISVYGERLSLPVSNEEFPRKISEGPIKFSGNRYNSSDNSSVSKTIASKDRILCLTDGRIENSMNKNSLLDSITTTSTNLKKVSNKEPMKPESDSSNSNKKSSVKFEMIQRANFKAASLHSKKVLRRGGKRHLSQANPKGKIVEEVKQPNRGNDVVIANPQAERRAQTHKCGLANDLKSGQIDSGKISQSDTPLKLLNFPGGKNRYDASLKKLELDENKKVANTDVGDFATSKKQNKLAADSSKGHYMHQRIRSSLGNRNAHHKALNLEIPNKKLSKNKWSKKNELLKQKGKSSKKVTFQVPKGSKKVVKDLQKTNLKQSRQVVNQCRTVKKMQAPPVSKNAVSSKNTIDKKKSEPADVTMKGSNSAKGDEWESKYFTKASEMFFKMFRDSVADNNISVGRTQMKMNGGDKNKSQEAKSNLPRTSSSVQPPLINNKDAFRCNEDAGVNRTYLSNKSIELNNKGECAKLDVDAKKPENTKLPASTISDIKKGKTLQMSVNTESNSASKHNSPKKVTSAKSTEGSSMNKLKMLQSSDSKATSESSREGNKGADSIFNTKMTGMDKYQLEKSDNVKKEISVNPPIDVEKLFEESSTIPLHGTSAKNKWQPTNIADGKGKTMPISSHKVMNATSDKGRGDSFNMIDFSIYKSALLSDQASLRNEVGLSREKKSSDSQMSALSSSLKPPSSVRDSISWGSPPISVVPISSKTIKQVNPQNYKEQILNSGLKKIEDEASKSAKTNKWERIVNIFKQIIVKDLEEERPDLARSVKATKTVTKLPVKLRETESTASYSQVKQQKGATRPGNHKTVKGKISSKVKKKTDVVTKKFPGETIRRNKVVKNNPKKIVNYFSKRGNDISEYEKSSVSGFSGNSFEQAPTSINDHGVNVGKHKQSQQ